MRAGFAFAAGSVNRPYLQLVNRRANIFHRHIAR